MIEGGFADRIYPTTKLGPIVGLLRQSGVRPERALRAAGLRIEDVESPSTLISINQVLAVYQAIIAETHDATLAYHLGLAFHVTTYGMYGFALLSSANLGRALEIATRYGLLGTPLVRVTFAVEGSSAMLRMEPIAHPRLIGALYEFVIRLYTGIVFALYREVMGEDFRRPRVGLPFALAPGEADGIDGLKVAPEQVDGREAWIQFDAATLGQATRMGDPAVNRLLLDICDAQIEALRRREGYAGQLRTLLITNGSRILSPGDAARKLGTTERSLRRRLAAEGVSFRTVQDDVQLNIAIKYLRDTELTVETIAEFLGFSDAANFRRAFRRWTGKAPLHYRRAAPAEG